MNNIYEYIKSTAPEIAAAANSKSTRNALRREAREYMGYLIRVRNMAEQCGWHIEVARANEELAHIGKWLIKFGLNEEE